MVRKSTYLDGIKMLQTITIKNYATYNNIGCTCESLNKINFIYGANGTGKTTISNYLNAPNREEYTDCQILWQDSPLEVLVYNKTFREDNFTDGDIKGIFTLGTATQKEIELIKQKELERNNLKEEGSQLRRTLEKQEKTLLEVKKNFPELLWNNYYKKHVNSFNAAFKGAKYKKTFQNKLLDKHNNLPDSIKPYDELLQKASMIFADTQPEAISTIPLLTYEKITHLEENELWSQVIVGKSDIPISNLIQQLNLTDWVNQGKGYINELDNETCPFCQQPTITENFKAQLENYFDTIYLQDIETIKQLSSNYEHQVNYILSAFDSIEKSNNSKLNVEKFSLLHKAVEQQLLYNKEKMQQKIREPSRKVELKNSQNDFVDINKLIKEANDEIIKHNNIANNFKSEKTSLINDVWDFIVLEAKADIEEYLQTCNGLNMGITNIETDLENKRRLYQTLTNKIISLQNNLTDIQPTINEINRLLTHYGFINFHIVKSSQNGFYQIQRRDGSLAHTTLSEGEVTFITFLYFLQLSKGSINPNNISNQRVVVIDDPISSLDSNILFVVSTLIKSLIQDIRHNNINVKQLIVLTHNVYFHKETTFSARDNGFNDINHWVLRKNGNVSIIESYGHNNPIKSSYTLLWQEYQNQTITSTVSIQNIMRRIIENYFKFLGGYKDTDLIHQFESEEERKICQSLISWINDGSHSVHDDLYIESPIQTIHTYKKVFKEVFYKTGHAAHYNMMMEQNTT